MLNRYRSFLLLMFLAGAGLFMSGCEKSWEEYYKGEANSEISLWDALTTNEDYSEFADLVESAGFDTIIRSSQTYTLFVPPNEAFTDFEQDSVELLQMLSYHISPTIILPASFQNERKLETYTDKFAQLEKTASMMYFDGIAILNQSMLYRDGIIYEIEQVASPRPNLYEYIDQMNSRLSGYIDSRDSVALDYSQSVPTGFDDEGNTIYDSVFIITNRFERDFFPVSLESRYNEATMLLVTDEDYNNALDVMADNLGGSFTNHADIPSDWQTEFLIPYIFNNGVFNGSRDFQFFMNDSVENIQGVLIPMNHTNIDQDSKTICSNGLAYQYLDFQIPGALYLEEIKYEGESYVIDQGSGFFAWDAELISTSNDLIQPKILDNISASEEQYITVDFPRGSTEIYSLEIQLPKIFPRPYKLVWRGYYRPSGIVKFYVNDVYVGEFDNYNFRYPVNGNNPENFFNHIEFDVDNITTYDDIVVKIEYTGPGIGSQNGICIDYLSLVPAN